MRSVEEKLEFKKQLEQRTASFAVSVFKFLNALPVTVASKVIAFQLGKSASSIGANYREANRAESEDDFIHKIGLCLKECAETVYWIELLQGLHSEDANCVRLKTECDEFVRIFSPSSARCTRKGRGNNRI